MRALREAVAGEGGVAVSGRELKIVAASDVKPGDLVRYAGAWRIVGEVRTSPVPPSYWSAEGEFLGRACGPKVSVRRRSGQ